LHLAASGLFFTTVTYVSIRSLRKKRRLPCQIQKFSYLPNVPWRQKKAFTFFKEHHERKFCGGFFFWRERRGILRRERIKTYVTGVKCKPDEARRKKIRKILVLCK